MYNCMFRIDSSLLLLPFFFILDLSFLLSPIFHSWSNSSSGSSWFFLVDIYPCCPLFIPFLFRLFSRVTKYKMLLVLWTVYFEISCILLRYWMNSIFNLCFEPSLFYLKEQRNYRGPKRVQENTKSHLGVLSMTRS